MPFLLLGGSFSQLYQTPGFLNSGLLRRHGEAGAGPGAGTPMEAGHFLPGKGERRIAIPARMDYNGERGKGAEPCRFFGRR